MERSIFDVAEKRSQATRRHGRKQEEREAEAARRAKYRLSVEPVRVRLPFPPMLNRYYRTAIIAGHAMTYISKDGKSFQASVIELWRHVAVTFAGRLALRVDVVYPDAKERDIDGILKALLDSLQHAGAYADDSQVKLLIVEQNRTASPGWVDIILGPKPGEARQGTLFETAW